MEKARRAGMGTRAAMKKAIMLLTEVRATLVPVRLRHSPVRSCGAQRDTVTRERREQLGSPGEQGSALTLKGTCWLVSVKA